MSPVPTDILYPNKLIKSQAVLQGELLVSDLRRVKSTLESDADKISYRLEFTQDELKRKCIKVSISSTLSVLCQRCLGEVRIDVDSENILAIIASNDEAQGLPAEYEPLLVAEDKLSLRDLIEDELLLALPIVPTHIEDECPMKLTPTLKDEKQNPFAVIKQLQKRK